MDITEETLMALADGELRGAEAASVVDQVEKDAALKERLAKIERTRALAKAAFGSVIEEPVPERLLVAASARRGRFAWASGRWALGWLPLGAVALAASAAGIAIGLGLTLGEGGGPSLFASEERIAALLEEAPSGEKRSLALGSADEPATFEATASYVAADGFCRTFVLTSASETGWRGLACRRDGNWTIDIAVADPAVDGYETASNAALQSVDAYLDAAGAGGRVDDDEERRLLQSHWTPR
ncbi:MAG TPA: hypothetical protein VGA77_02265 [Propylenella sp.]